MPDAAQFGRRHPRLVGAFGVVLFGPVLVLAAANVRSPLWMAAAGAVGLGFAGMLILRGNRLPRWGGAVFFGYVALVALFTQRRESPTTQLGWISLFSLCVCLVTIMVALLAGFRRTAETPDDD